MKNNGNNENNINNGSNNQRMAKSNGGISMA